MGGHALLQGILPTQGSNLGLLHQQADSLWLSHQGSPIQTRICADMSLNSGLHREAENSSCGVTAGQTWRGCLRTWGWPCVAETTAGVFSPSQPALGVPVAVCFTTSHQESERRTALSAFPSKSAWSLCSSAQLVFASQNFHFEKKTSERDFDV